MISTKAFLIKLFKNFEEQVKDFFNVTSKDVEAVKFLMLPLPAPLEVLCF